MSSRLRTLDSRISFFAFADIITAVSGMLIFITLLLATDLGKPTDDRSSAASAEIERRLEETLRQQLETDAQNRRLQELLAAAETAPAVEKLESDISRLRSQLSEERQKQSVLVEQIKQSESAIQARDKTLGLTDLKNTIQRTIQEAEAIVRQEAKARKEMETLEQQVAVTQSRLLKLRAWEGQVWFIPDKSATTKEPILVTVAGTGADAQGFDHPEQRKQWDKASAEYSFETYLQKANRLNQYVVFLVRPSGIQLFQNLVKSARTANFEVGFDALEEDREAHFSAPPAVDEPLPPKTVPVITPDQRPSTPNSGAASPAKAQPATASAKTNNPPPVVAAVPQPQKKSWWRRFLEWVGIA